MSIAQETMRMLQASYERRLYGLAEGEDLLCLVSAPYGPVRVHCISYNEPDTLVFIADNELIMQHVSQLNLSFKIVKLKPNEQRRPIGFKASSD